MTLFLILLCSLLPTVPVLGPLQPPKSEVGVDNEGFTVADPGEGLGWPATTHPTPPPHPGKGLAPLPSHIFLDQNEARSSSSCQMGGVNVEDGRRGLMYRYPNCTFLKESNFNFKCRYVSRANKNTTFFNMQSICLSSL